MFAENNPTLLHSKEMLTSLPGVLYTIEATDAVPGDCKCPESIVSSTQNRKQTNAGGLAKCLEVKIRGQGYDNCEY